MLNQDVNTKTYGIAVHYVPGGACAPFCCQYSMILLSRQGFLFKLDTIFLQFCHQGIINLWCHRCYYALLRDRAVQDLLHSNTTRYTFKVTSVQQSNWIRRPGSTYPTSLAMAEYPLGSPYSQRVEVLVSFDPSLFSTSNLCCSMTMSLSSGP